MAGRDPDSYEWAIARVTELEVDLGTAMTGLERAQADNQALRDIHDDLVITYRKLQDQHQRLRQSYRKLQEEDRQLAAEQQEQITHWKLQLESKAKECEELQQQLMAPREMDAFRLQLAEEVEEPLQQKLRVMEARLSGEQRRVLDLQRQMEASRAKAAHHEVELQDELAETVRGFRHREQDLESKISLLEAEAKKVPGHETTITSLRGQLRELEAKVAGLHRALKEQVDLSERERLAATADLRAKVEEVTTSLRTTRDLQLQLDQEQRRTQQLSTELEAARKLQGRLTQQVEQAEAQAQAALRSLPEESRRVREEAAHQVQELTAERMQLTKALKVAEEHHQTMNVALKRAEARLLQEEQERQSREKELLEEKTEAERRLVTENATLRAQLAAAENEAEARRQNWRERETLLVKQVDSASARVEAVGDELIQCQAAQEELERQQQASQQEHQQQLSLFQAATRQLEADVAVLHDKAERLERERAQQGAAADLARASLRKQEQRADALQTELAALSARLDEERKHRSIEAEEAHQSLLAAEEAAKSAALQRQAEEHQRQMGKLQSATKRLLHKAKQRRQEYRQRCQELVKRIAILQQEKAAAIRVCEENKSVYELRLTEMGLAVSGGSRFSPSDLGILARPGEPGLVSNRRELQAISERLERQAERLRSRTGGASPSSEPLRP